MIPRPSPRFLHRLEIIILLAMESSTRYEACHLLRHDGVGCSLWVEDAVRFYGVETMLFKPYIMVADIDQAGRVLSRRVWKPNRPLSNDFNPFLGDADDTTYRRLLPQKYRCDSAGRTRFTGHRRRIESTRDT